jgi:ATP-dependent Lon protease
MGNTMTSGCIQRMTIQTCFRHESGPQGGDCREEAPPIRCISSNRDPRLLIVDDEDAVRRMLSQALRKIGRIDVCESASEALEQARNRCYDAVISDMDMPGMNGPELYRQIRLANEPASRRFIFISGGEHPEIKRLAEKGLIVFLRKPFLMSEMRNAVETVVHRCG